MKKTVHLGCSAFYNYHWKKIFYPENIPSKNWFEFYSSNFNSFEINGTFYKFPTVTVMENWYKRSPENYNFSVKAPKSITHIKKFVDCGEEIKKFYEVSENGLKEKLGCFLFQFPPSFDYSQEKLKMIIENLDTKYKNVIEFRHQSWWKKEVIDTLNSNKITFCSVSHPKLPEEIVLNKLVYIRLHGNTKMFYSSYSTDEIKKMIAYFTEIDLVKTVYIYFNNTASSAGILNALETKKRLEL
jgi:uncharacterized protein YecE (DUF72 family)